jgi:mono/diheme cytochrome c family protein
MSAIIRLALCACIAIGVCLAASLPGDSARGETIFKSQGCVGCHSVNGAGGRTAADLGKPTGAGYPPSEMAALMWNHAPQMFAAIAKSGKPMPKLPAEDAADLFAYIYAAKYADPAGDVARGRKLFVNKGCNECHNITSSHASGAKPVMNWEAVIDSVELARQMWNHAPKMRAAMESKNMVPLTLTAAEMADIIAYLRSLPQTKHMQAKLITASPQTGATLFQAKGCADCHKGAQSLAARRSYRRMGDLAAGMWNHAGKMKVMAEIRPEEMRRLAGYILSLQFEDEGGTAARGEKVYASRGCKGCHEPKEAPKLPAGLNANGFKMVAELWSHGPAMLKQIQSAKMRWPSFKTGEMADLLAYLKAKS